MGNITDTTAPRSSAPEQITRSRLCRGINTDQDTGPDHSRRIAKRHPKNSRVFLAVDAQRASKESPPRKHFSAHSSLARSASRHAARIAAENGQRAGCPVVAERGQATPAEPAQERRLRHCQKKLAKPITPRPAKATIVDGSGVLKPGGSAKAGLAIVARAINVNTGTTKLKRFMEYLLSCNGWNTRTLSSRGPSPSLPVNFIAISIKEVLFPSIIFAGFSARIRILAIGLRKCEVLEGRAGRWYGYVSAKKAQKIRRKA